VATVLDAGVVKAWRNAIFVIFAACGIGLATWVSRTPAVRDGLAASTADMGWIIFGLAGGSIFGLTASSHILARVGGRATIRYALLLSCVGLTLAGVGSLVSSAGVVFGGLALFGAGYGLCDVAMNVEGAANERALGHTIMPLFHAAFSLGTIVGAAIGTAAEFARVPVVLHLGVGAAVLAVTTLVAVRFIPPAAESAGPDPTPVTRGARLAVWREPRTLLIGVMVLGLAFAEGSANDWLALAMVDGHQVSNAAGAGVFGIFVTAMTVGRIAGSGLLDRYGRVRVLRASAVSAVVGLVIVIFVPHAGVATVGVVLWGLGSALGFPVGVSAAADDPRLAPARVSAVATIGYLAFLAGPPVLGLLGYRIGLLRALTVVLVLVAVAGAVSGAARPLPTPRPEPAARG
jgi:fucose permease